MLGNLGSTVRRKPGVIAGQAFWISDLCSIKPHGWPSSNPSKNILLTWSQAGSPVGQHIAVTHPRIILALYFKTGAGLHPNSYASGDSLAKVTISSILCGLCSNQNPLGLRIVRCGGYHWVTMPARNYLWVANQTMKFVKQRSCEIWSGYMAESSLESKPVNLLVKAGKEGSTMRPQVLSPLFPSSLVW